jgi:hypothetical protein
MLVMEGLESRVRTEGKTDIVLEGALEAYKRGIDPMYSVQLQYIHLLVTQSPSNF